MRKRYLVNLLRKKRVPVAYLDIMDPYILSVRRLSRYVMIGALAVQPTLDG